MLAGAAANENDKPIVFDPVAVGASDLRRTSAARTLLALSSSSEGHLSLVSDPQRPTPSGLLNTWQPTVIKGNAGEIGALAGSTEVTSRGVDSGGGFKDPVAIVKSLAIKERKTALCSSSFA